jgi:hypothetical protein
MSEPPPRPLARVLRGGREGEVMDRRDTSHGVRYDLRPVGGGREWTVPREFVQLLDRESAT